MLAATPSFHAGDESAKIDAAALSKFSQMDKISMAQASIKLRQLSTPAGAWPVTGWKVVVVVVVVALTVAVVVV